MATFTFKMTDADIEKGIKSIKSRAQSLRKDIDKVVVSIIHNWAADGAVNVTAQRMSQLLDALDASHQQKLVNWCNAKCSFTLDEDDDGNNVFRYDAGRTKMTKDEFAAAKTVTIWDFTPDKPLVAFNFEQKLRALIAQAKKRPSSKAATDEDVIDADMLKAAEALLPAES